tara:strand:+ start:1659 stop:1931 length:273 start_codon:yes stop_codon:yes gene_type:complete
VRGPEWSLIGIVDNRYFLWRLVMTTVVYLLEHTVKGLEDSTKMLGIYSTREEAENAINFLSNKPGFRDSLDDFLIDEYEIDKICWSSGFG